ncbi:MAG TPA: DUF3501 family protein [Rhizobacter sp.]|nr:DUF3501 family protein [Rhizobacter sp.]
MALLLSAPLADERRRHKQILMTHRRERSLALGPCMSLQFEDELTVHHQIQEVLRAEPGSNPQHEAAIYAHLLPDGSNWKATLLIGVPDAEQRARELPQLSEAAHRLYIELPRHPRVFAQANEDLPCRQLARPSAVHFLRFQFPEPLRVALLAGASATLGCAHDQYAFRRLIPLAMLERLRCDLAPHRHE